MPKIRFITLFCLFIVLAFAMPAFAGEKFQGKVVGISDGDTITVLAEGNRQVKVRLYGIDCPESRQAFGNRAKQAASSLVFGKTVEVETMHTDRYGRTVGIVISEDGENLNGELVATGFAWVYPRYCKAPICAKWEKLEDLARNGRIGLWKDKEPLPPWKWRKEKRKR